ncbi:hypothetical protein IW262DRAFT_464882 [Armillaria fumosa]|nr:hypothetical protein IW262DRAFT_464882 [Armillaria fumosa]
MKDGALMDLINFPSLMLMACQCELGRAVLIDLKFEDAVRESLSSEYTTPFVGPDITLAGTEANQPAINMCICWADGCFTDPATLVWISTENHEYHLRGGFRDMRIHFCLEDTISIWSPIREPSILCFIFLSLCPVLVHEILPIESEGLSDTELVP